MSIIIDLDAVTICGKRIERPVHISRSHWVAFWEYAAGGGSQP